MKSSATIVARACSRWTRAFVAPSNALSRAAKSGEQLRQTIKGDPDAPQRRMLGTDALALPACDRVEVQAELIGEPCLTAMPPAS
jgi:hypothetical protein